VKTTQKPDWLLDCFTGREKHASSESE